MENKKNGLKQKSVVREEEATALLVPILAFLQASGMPIANTERAFKSAWNKALRIKSSVAVSNLRNVNDYADIIGLWTKSSDYMNSVGEPRVLSYGGKRGFSGLVRRATKRVETSTALEVLIKFGNVERIASKKLKLVQPFLHVRSSEELAFEPSARFLSDASETVRHLLGKRRAHASTPKLFWRTADTSDLPESAVPAYIKFARSRSLVFLQEIDDWLQSHATMKRTVRSRRVGMGVFSICGKRTAL